jgi:hypothetical protein
LYPEKNRHILKDALGSLYNAQFVIGKWHVTTIAKSFHDGFFLNAEERRLMTENRKIPAIKSIRTRFNLGLAEAKDHVELFAEYYRLHELIHEKCFHSFEFILHDENMKLCKCCGQYVS